MTEQAKASETVEVIEPTVVEKVVIDEGTASESGLNAKEIEMGKKHGFIKSEEEGQKKEDETKKDKKNEEESSGKKPDISAEEIRKKQLGDISEEESAKLTKTEQGYYWQQKKERAKRQTAELDRDYYRMKIAALEEEVKNIKSKKTEKTERDEIDDLFEEGNEDVSSDKEEKKTLTKEEWQEEFRKEQEEMKVQQQRVNARLNEFEAEFKENHPDLGGVLDLATDLFNNYERIYKGDPKKIEETKAKIKEWTLSAADMFNPDSKNLTQLAYEIGKTHPNYKPSGKDTADDEGKEEGKGSGDDISDDKMKKLLASQKGKTSASLSGGGSRVPVSELTLEQARNLPISEWRKIPKETRDKLMGKP